MLLPLFLVFANTLTENGPITLRYTYPFLGIILIWVAFFIEKIRKESLVIPLAIIVLWASFQGLNIYSFYKESGMIDGLTPVKKPFPLKSALDFLKSKNTRFVYTGFYTAIQAQLVETQEMLVTSNSPSNWGRLSRKKPVSLDNFAIIVSSIGSNTDLDFYMADDLYEYSHASKKQEAARIETLKNNQYRKFLDENQIIYKNKRIGPHHIFWNIQANKEQFESLKKL